MSFDSFIAQTLQLSKQRNRYRVRKTVTHIDGVSVYINGESQPLTNFCSNDYLGLTQHPNVVAAGQKAANQFGSGSGASHLVSGHSALHQQCEQTLAEFVGRERALLFSTGYMANLGVINGLLDKHDAVFQDKLNHASLIDGALLSRAKLCRYRHNDVVQLNNVLAASTATKKLVAVDGVFSMDGDSAPLKAIAAACQKHNAWLMVDDAHGLGCTGVNGRGSLSEAGLSENDVPLLMGTLGKALGTFGAFVAGKKDVIDALIQLSRTYIYTTALPPAVAASTIASVETLQAEPWRIARLNERISQFKHACAERGIALLPSNSAIQPVILGDENTAMAVSAYLQQQGFWVVAIRPPTVPKGTSRLRITLSAEHTIEQIDSLINALACGLKNSKPAE